MRELNLGLIPLNHWILILKTKKSPNKYYLHVKINLMGVCEGWEWKPKKTHMNAHNNFT